MLEGGGKGVILTSRRTRKRVTLDASLYARLQDERDDAYPYYNALLNRLNSFCNALELRYQYKRSNNA